MHCNRRFLAGLALACLAVTTPVPTIACDPDTMNEELAELCRSPLTELGEMLSQARQPASVTAGLRQRLEDARVACREGNYETGLAQGIRLAREIGRLEARTLALAE